MQRGRDADVAAKLQQQYQKEVSDQQWHLSIIPESHSINHRSLNTEISYEPSFRTFETKSPQASLEKSTVTEGRKVFGGFVPDIDELLESARAEQGEEEVYDGPVTISTRNRQKSGLRQGSKRQREEGDSIEKKHKQKKSKKKETGNM